MRVFKLPGWTHISEANFSSRTKVSETLDFSLWESNKRVVFLTFFSALERRRGRYQSFCGTTATILGQGEEEEEDMVSSSLLPPNPPPLTHLRKSWERRKSPTEIDKWRVFPFQIHRAVC